MAPLYANPEFRVVGDRGLLVEYGDEIAPEINLKVRCSALALSKAQLVGIVEIIPAYRSLLIVYDPLVTNIGKLREFLLPVDSQVDELDIPLPKLVEIPVVYGGDFGPDIGFVAASHDLTIGDVVKLHSGVVYQIYMIGFTPGFPFLGGLPEILNTPRMETPRTAVPAGSVGIANNQSGIYPAESPGGWRIIGRSPLKLFDPSKENPFLYEAGDSIKFVPISEETYLRLSECNSRIVNIQLRTLQMSLVKRIEMNQEISPKSEREPNCLLK
jgi:inhibitor of KinA